MPGLIKTSYAPNRDGLTLGIMSSELEESHRAQMDMLVGRFAHLKEFWVLMGCRSNGTQLKRTYMAFSEVPAVKRFVGGELRAIPFIGTVCYYRDNTWPEDKWLRVWCLLPDMPIPDSMFEGGEDSDPNPADDAWRLGVPMLY